jgi:hypothetical protein
VRVSFALFKTTCSGLVIEVFLELVKQLRFLISNTKDSTIKSVTKILS